jgi:ketosteroid isomerase-like protein
MNKLAQAILTVMLTLVVALAGAAQTKASANKAASGEAEFRKLIEEYYTAWSMLNTDAPAKFYAKDADLIFYDIAPMKYNGWQEYHDGVQKYFFDMATSAKLTPNLNDLKVTVRGDVAWTTVTFRLSSTLKAGGTQELEARHTAIWERRNGHWLIVHEHVSVPLPG